MFKVISDKLENCYDRNTILNEINFCNAKEINIVFMLIISNKIKCVNLLQLEPCNDM